MALVAAFDVENTIIETKSKRVYPTDESDWKWRPNAKKKLLELRRKGYQLVFFSNQKRSPKNLTHEKLGAKFKQMNNDIGFELDVFLCFDEWTLCWKPLIGMWTSFKSENNLTEFDERSFYCGKSAGREKDKGNEDACFAFNIKLQFFTPEQVFKKSEYYAPFPELPSSHGNFDLTIRRSPEMLMIMGPPCSGKTITAMCFMQYGYLFVAGGALESAKSAVKTGIPFVIDDYFLTIADRKNFIDIAKAEGYKVRIIFLDLSLEHCLHNYFVELCERDEDLPAFDTQRFKKMIKELQTPTVDEGFDDILIVDKAPLNADYRF